MKEYGEFRLEAEQQNLAYRPNLAEEMRHLLKGIEALGQFLPAGTWRSRRRDPAHLAAYR